MFFKAIMQFVQDSEGGRRAYFRDLAGHASFQYGHDRKDVCEIGQRQFSDEAAPMRPEVSQAFCGQNFQSFTQWCATDAKLLGKDSFVQPLPRKRFVLANAFAQQIDSLLC